MARFKRLHILNTLLQTRLVPLFYHADADTAINITDAIAAGGAKIIEFTNRGEGALEVFHTLNKHLKANHPDVILGVGSILDASTAALFVAHGANFIVSPAFVKETALLCNRRMIPYMPGCGTITEISNAQESGVEVCKIFPGSQVGGPGFIKAARAPMPWAQLMPTGGVDATRESIASWLQAGACAVGMGSKLVKNEWVENNEFDNISQSVKNCLAWISELN